MVKVVEGTARHLVKTFDVKKRTYYGNTSMEAEISLLMANQTLVCCSLSSSDFLRTVINKSTGFTWEIDLRSIRGHRKYGICMFFRS